MSKGKARRRRVRNALRANEGNLVKAQLGKVRLSAALPRAPKPAELAERLPRSLQKLVDLKAADERSRVEKAASRPQLGRTQAPARAAKAEGQRAKKRRRAAQEPHGGVDDAGAGAAARSGAARGGVGAEERLEPVWDDSESKSKKRRKAKMRERDKQAKLLRTQKSDDQLVAQAEEARTRVPFGEVAAAPLKVQLKRRHWAEQQRQTNGAAAAGDGQRLKQIQLRQLQAAAAAAGALRPAQKPSAPIGLRQTGQAEAVRQQVINAYRAQRRNATGLATETTLARLVHQPRSRADLDE